MLRQCLVFLSLVAVGLVGCNRHSASPTQPQETVIAAGEIGSRVPDFSVKDLRGHPPSSADLPGKVVPVDFWATAIVMHTLASNQEGSLVQGLTAHSHPRSHWDWI
jgi:hypothetical protein